MRKTEKEVQAHENEGGVNDKNEQTETVKKQNWELKRTEKKSIQLFYHFSAYSSFLGSERN
jgi:hypothetical protein